MYISRQPEKSTHSTLPVSIPVNYKFYEYARHGMVDGLKKLNVKKILIPDFICNVVTDELSRNSIDYIFYKIGLNFQANLLDVEDLLDSKDIDAFLHVSYFGIPFQISEQLEFCKKYNIKFILDNAHGFGGRYLDRDLLEYGDMAFSSIRKIYNLNTGAVARFNGESSLINEVEMSTFSLPIVKKILLRSRLFRMFFVKKRTSKLLVSTMEDAKTENRLNANNFNPVFSGIEIHKKKRNEIFQMYLKHFKRLNDVQVIDSISGSDPCYLLFPVFFQSVELRDLALKNSFLIGFDSFTWPSLPLEIGQHDCFDRLVCFPINPDYDLENFEHMILKFIKFWSQK